MSLRALCCFAMLISGVGVAACDNGQPDRVMTSVSRDVGVRTAHPSDQGEPTQPDQPSPAQPDPVVADPDPTDPTDPTAPTDPTDPTAPTDPTEPTDPTDPVDPTHGGDVPLACPAGVSCVDAFPFVATGDTTGGTSLYDRYACAPQTNESGPEVAYRLELSEPGLLVAALSGLPSGVDVDVHIVSGDAIDPNTCDDRGHWNAAAWLPAGVHWVVVDSFVNAAGKALAGPYTLSLGFTKAADFEAQDLDRDVLEKALKAYALAWSEGDTERFELTVVDFSLHSIHPRLWTIDLSDGSLLFHQRVCHGEGSADASDPGWATAFSNTEGSHQSSLGLMKTGARFDSSSNGLSLRLDGLEDGINDGVRARAIVIHSDSYATDAYAEAHNRMGLSWGCLVIDPARIEDFVSTVEDGTLVWSWYPDDAFVAKSTYLY